MLAFAFSIDIMTLSDPSRIQPKHNVLSAFSKSEAIVLRLGLKMGISHR